MRVLGDAERDQKRVICFVVPVGGVTTRGSRGPAVTLTMDMKAWGCWCVSVCVRACAREK